MVFIKRLEHFLASAGFRKKLSAKRAASAYAAMEEVNVLFEDEIKPLPPPLGQECFQETFVKLVAGL